VPTVVDDLEDAPPKGGKKTRRQGLMAVAFSTDYCKYGYFNSCPVWLCGSFGYHLMAFRGLTTYLLSWSPSKSLYVLLSHFLSFHSAGTFAKLLRSCYPRRSDGSRFSFLPFRSGMPAPVVASHRLKSITYLNAKISVSYLSWTIRGCSEKEEGNDGAVRGWELGMRSEE